MEASREARLEVKMRQEGVTLSLRNLGRTSPQGRYVNADEAGVPSYSVDVVLGQLQRFIDVAIPASEVLQHVVIEANTLRSRLQYPAVERVMSTLASEKDVDPEEVSS